MFSTPASNFKASFRLNFANNPAITYPSLEPSSLLSFPADAVLGLPDTAVVGVDDPVPAVGVGEKPVGLVVQEGDLRHR